MISFRVSKPKHGPIFVISHEYIYRVSKRIQSYFQLIRNSSVIIMFSVDCGEKDGYKFIEAEIGLFGYIAIGGIQIEPANE